MRVIKPSERAKLLKRAGKLGQSPSQKAEERREKEFQRLLSKSR